MIFFQLFFFFAISMNHSREICRKSHRRVLYRCVAVRYRARSCCSSVARRRDSPFYLVKVDPILRLPPPSIHRLTKFDPFTGSQSSHACTSQPNSARLPRDCGTTVRIVTAVSVILTRDGIRTMGALTRYRDCHYYRGNETVSRLSLGFDLRRRN